MSIYNILPINQINSKELLDNLKLILKAQFVDWVSIKENSSFAIDFVDVHDAKKIIYDDKMLSME